MPGLRHRFAPLPWVLAISSACALTAASAPTPATSSASTHDPQGLDVLAGLVGRPASDPDARRLRDHYAPTMRLGLDGSVSALDPDEFIVAERGEADDVRGEADVSLTLVQGSRPVAHGSLSLPLPKEGFYWKDWQPGLAARTALGADIYAITVEFHYWGGSGMGQLGSRNDVVYLFARRGNRFALMMGAHVRSHDFDYSDCADDDDACFARPQGHEDPPQHYRLMAATAAAVSGERPRFELSDGEARMTSRWDEAAGRYDPHLLTW